MPAASCLLPAPLPHCCFGWQAGQLLPLGGVAAAATASGVDLAGLLREFLEGVMLSCRRFKVRGKGGKGAQGKGQGGSG